MRGRGQDLFTTIRAEGRILPSGLLQRISENDRGLDGLRPEDYHLSGETTNEAISRSWNRLKGSWAAFTERRDALPETEPETAMTRERWLLPLFRELDYGRLQTARAVEIGDKSYPVSHAWEHTPIHLIGFRADLDTRTSRRAGAARMSPHSLVQELVSRSDDHLWAFVSNGLRLRILRDNLSLTRQSYVEFDLEAMMDGEVYPDFVLLWMLCHQSRVEVAEGQRLENCWLERWSQAAQEQGSRALDRLRLGVEKAINTLGSGFLSHRDNTVLKKRLRDGDLQVQDYYRQLLRLVYRLLFLFVAEDRGHLLDPDADEIAKDRYRRFYSTRKLRRHAEKRVGGRHPDLYRQLASVVKMLGEDDGCPALALPALGGFLFDEDAAPDLADADIANRDLLDAVRALAFVDEGAGLAPVDYEHLGAEELGSVYESLLELAPVLDSDSGAFALEAVGGNERKTTGSYYTPDSLVNSLLDTALDPVLDEAAAKPDPERAILDLKVCDPAVGSGHFLIRAAHRIARRLASIRTGDAEPAPGPYREALRDVVGRCLYGVDVNPMSAELCRFNLLLEGLAPGKPLSFLEGHIKVGNSLLGTTPDLIQAGIPDDAFKPIEGDNRAITSAYRKRNKAEREALESGQESFDLRGYDAEVERLRLGYREIEATPDRTAREVREKRALYEKLESSEEMFHARRVADAWCAAFVWPKREGAPEPITQETFAYLTLNTYTAERETEQEIERLAAEYKFFHWHVAFPNVFGERVEQPGFDVVLGNPPWEKVKVQEKEWFASRLPEISVAPNAAARKRLINRLKSEDPTLHTAFLDDLRKAEGESHFIRNSHRYPLCGKGDINTYSIFAETNRSIISTTGQVGCIVPSGIATDDTTKEFFGDLVSTGTLASLYEFENEGFFSAGQGHMVRFVLLTLLGQDRQAEATDFFFQGQSLQELSDPGRHFLLSVEDICLLNPNTRTCPIFRTRRDAEITKGIYRRVPILINENNKDGNPWAIRFMAMFHMSNDSGLFRTNEELDAEGWELKGNFFRMGHKRYLPLYQSKMFHHYNHRYGDFDLLPPGSKGHVLPDVPVSLLENARYSPKPKYWVPEAEVEGKLENNWAHQWLLTWRKITDARASARTVVFSVVPRAGVGDGSPLLLPNPPVDKLKGLLQANLSAYVFDYAARQKLGGTNLTHGYMKQFPVLPPSEYRHPVTWNPQELLADWIAPRVLELTYTAWDLEPFARDLGYDGPPFRWDPERRFVLRCELDAAFFHLYGIGRDDADYIMETFPIVKRKDEAAHGEYRTKRVILEIYDQMARAAETGEPYRTPLDPPPVDLGASGAATVTPLRPRTEPRPESAPSLPQAAEERGEYATEPPVHEAPEPEESANGATDAAPANAESSDPLPERQDDETGNTGGPVEGEQQSPVVGQPNLYEAALALHALIPAGERMEREDLFADAARELGHKKVNRRVRRSLNKALRAEMSAGRLETDWDEVWKPGRTG